MTRPMRRFVMNVGFMFLGFIAAGAIAVVHNMTRDLETMRRQVDLLTRQVQNIDSLIIR